MIRVAVVIEALGRGGAERLLVETARLLDRSRFLLRVYTLFPIRRDYAESLRALAVQEECLDLVGPRQVWTGVRRLRARLREQRPDLVHTHLFWASVVGRLAGHLERVPIVSTYHGADYEPIVRRSNPRLTPFKQTTLRLVDALSSSWSGARIVTVSEYLRASIHRRLFTARSRITVIPNAVDTEVFAPDEARRSAVRVALGLESSALVVACVGRLIPEKAQDVLLRAFAGVHAAIPESRLLLVGDGPQRREYQELTQTLGLGEVVRFLGLRDDVPDILRAADVLVLPSRHEGFGLVLAEALACGVPVVATRTGPVPEIVRDGETGRLFPPEDVAALGREVIELLRDPERRRVMGVKGREDMRARFSLPLLVSRLESLYTTVAARQ